MGNQQLLGHSSWAGASRQNVLRRIQFERIHDRRSTRISSSSVRHFHYLTVILAQLSFFDPCRSNMSGTFLFALITIV